jgi:beta-N-acetylhexosaminidase
MQGGATELELAAGQVLLGGFAGHAVSPDFAALVARGQVGGAILFSRNFSDLAGARELVLRLHELPAPEPLLLSVDQEGGRVQRLRAPFPELPTMRAFGGLGRKSVVRRAGALLAHALRALGFHQDYAPVLDVDSNPANPVIGDRAFSRDAAAVARLGAAFIDGMQSAGLAACGKHFPGHGDTHQDSHHVLPRLDHDRERLDAVELVPFRAAVRVDVAAIMTAHIVFSALDPEHPATLSPKVLRPLLREELGYHGVIVSDDLEMKAIADHYGIEDAAVRAVAAGCDQLLICHQPALVERAHAALVTAVQRGELAKGRLLEAADRVRALKARYVVGKAGPHAGPLEALFDAAEHQALLAELASPSEPASERVAEDGIVEYDLARDPTEPLDLDV